MLVGEVPGDQEDLQGKPFVGPAGRLLDKALAAAGLDRKDLYMTNAVKHFKWEQRGKRRLHGRPSSREISACRPWLEAELAIVHPRTIVCLGATAAQTLLGQSFRLTRHFGESMRSPWADNIFATYHPSAILRAPDRDERERLTKLLVTHLKLAANT
jgi:DNA polymerase